MATVIFSINYHTVWGEELFLCGSAPELGSLDEERAIPFIADGDNWSASVNIAHAADITYYYFIRKEGNTIRREWENNRKIHITKGEREFIINDFWRDEPHHSYLYSTLFTDAVFRHEAVPPPTKYSPQEIGRASCRERV